MVGSIFQIQKFCTTDGPGIRTAVFFKGCPLHCLWCHNPESQSFKPELLFDKDKCIDCCGCVPLCPQNAHSAKDDRHLFDSSSCNGCGDCMTLCCPALELSGRQITDDEILEEVLKDKRFYDRTGGGLTLSGGEPLSQPAFCLSLLQKAKQAGLHTCIETCGFGSPESLREIAAYTDLFLFDYKLTDPALHKQYTGVDNALILSNLQLLNDLGKDIILRCPIIPGYNDDKAHFAAIGAFAEKHSHILQVEVEPYHSVGKSKYQKLGRTYALDVLAEPSRETVNFWIAEIQKQTEKPVKLP